MARSSTRLAVWLPDPLTVATWIVKSLTTTALFYFAGCDFTHGAVGEVGQVLPVLHPPPARFEVNDTKGTQRMALFIHEGHAEVSGDAECVHGRLLTIDLVRARVVNRQRTALGDGVVAERAARELAGRRKRLAEAGLA